MSAEQEIPTPRDPLDRRLTAERGERVRKPLRWPAGTPIVGGLAAAVLKEKAAHGAAEKLGEQLGPDHPEVVAAQEVADEASATVARLCSASSEPDSDDEVVAPDVGPEDGARCACGAARTWTYNVTQGRGFADGDDAQDVTAFYCAAHGPNTPPVAGAHPARPAFSSDEQLVAWERFRAATEQLHGAELAHREQAARLHEVVLAPAQREFREALQALTQSIAPAQDPRAQGAP